MRVVSAFVRRWSPGTGSCSADLERTAGEVLENRDRLPHRGLDPAADVVRAAPSLHRPHRRVHDVVDVRPAARLLAVAVEVERLLRGERARDLRERHVGALPRPEGVEVAQHDRVEPEAAAVRAGEMLARELRDAVRRDRRRRRVLRRRVALGLAVHRRRGGEDDADAVAGRGLEHALRREHVALDVEREHVAEAPHARLAREVEDTVEAREVELVPNEVALTHVQPLGVLLLEIRVVVVREAVDADDFVAARRERFREQRADEARRACDEISHDGLA